MEKDMDKMEEKHAGEIAAKDAEIESLSGRLACDSAILKSRTRLMNEYRARAESAESRVAELSKALADEMQRCDQVGNELGSENASLRIELASERQAREAAERELKEAMNLLRGFTDYRSITFGRCDEAFQFLRKVDAARSASPENPQEPASVEGGPR
jgi:chromosome segregation ATPase